MYDDSVFDRARINQASAAAQLTVLLKGRRPSGWGEDSCQIKSLSRGSHSSVKRRTSEFDRLCRDTEWGELPQSRSGVRTKEWRQRENHISEMVLSRVRSRF